MDRFPGYQSLLSRIEHKKAQVKSQLPIEHCHLVDEFAVFVLDQFNKCLDDVSSSAQDDDHFGTDGTVTRAPTSDIQIDNEQINHTSAPSTAANNHNREGSISSEQAVSPVVPPTHVTQSTIQTNIKVKVEDVSDGQSVQLCKRVKKEDEDGGEYVMECDCEDCEICRVKMEMKEELDESGEMEQMEDCVKQEIKKELEDGEMMHKEEEEEDGEVEGERPNKIQRMDRVLGNVPVGSPSSSSNVISNNVECPNDQVATSSTHPITIEDHTQTCQPVNETLLAEQPNGEPMMENVGLEVGVEEFDREQVDHDNSTLNQVNIDQDDEETEVDDNQNDEVQDEEEDGDEAIENREDPSAGDEQQVQVPAENFVKRIEPDEFGNKFECDYQACGKRMKTKQHLISHIRTHTGEKPFRCSVDGCDQAFVQNVQLKAHLNAHSGTRPFACSWPGCEAQFGNKINLTVHLRTHTGERPFRCDQCDVAFTRHGDLVTHLRTHTGTRPFECDQCDGTFTQSAHLVTHLRTHTGARPFVCTWPECGQAFTTSCNLKKHSIVHSNERQFACDVRGCTKVYKRKETLRLHQMAKHN